MRLTLIDRDCTHYATFQSHNQKVVQNRNGIFLTYLSRFEESAETSGWRERGRWHLARSTDQGGSFRHIHTMDIVGNKPACIETDEQDNLLLAGEDGSDPQNAHYYLRLSAAEGYRAPSLIRLPHQVLGKFAMEYDPSEGMVYFFDHYGWLYVITAATGEFRQIKVMHQNGPIGQTQYPHVYLDRDRVLHHAWTTAHKDKYLYWDIHYARSPDRGRTWTRADGAPLQTPFVPDDSGPSDQVILPDEFPVHTWLSSMIEKNGKIHFAYRAYHTDAGMNRQHYVRLDLMTGKIDKNVYPEWRVDGAGINSLDGFFATRRKDPNSPLYFVARTQDRRLAAVVSRDNGDEWRVLDASDPMPAGKDLYSIGGCCEVTSDGSVIGTFTMQKGDKGDPYFFQIAAGLLACRDVP